MKDQLDACLEQIKNDDIRNWTRDFLMNKVPDYFWVVGASSTGKYHPTYAQNKGGLIRHERAAVKIAIELIDNDLFDFIDHERDVIIAGLLLHDSFKYGKDKGKYTEFTHPLIAGDEVLKYEGISIETREEIKEIIYKHMGKWVKNYRTGKKLLDKPTTKIERFTHLCDYLASRKFLEVNFNEVDV